MKSKKTGKALIQEINSTKLEKSYAAFWWLGQLGYAIRMGNRTIYIDAFLSEDPLRNRKPPLEPKDITNADLIIGSHDHGDHIDREAWRIIASSSPGARFVVPEILVDNLMSSLDLPKDRFIGLNDQSDFKDAGLTITGIAAAHEFLDMDPESGLFPYLGYIIEYNDCAAYHSGDTCIYEGLHAKLRKWENINAMFLPINGRDAKRYRSGCIGNMTYQEAVDLAGEVSPKLVIPGHYEMFDFNCEDPKLFTEYLDAKYHGIKYWIGDYGEKAIFGH